MNSTLSATPTPDNSQGKDVVPTPAKKKLKHCDPLDDAIFSKRFGEACIYNKTITSTLKHLYTIKQ